MVIRILYSIYKNTKTKPIMKRNKDQCVYRKMVQCFLLLQLKMKKEPE